MIITAPVLFADMETAAGILGICSKTLRTIRRRYSDFPTVKVGEKVLVDIPAAYEWMREQKGIELGRA